MPEEKTQEQDQQTIKPPKGRAEAAQLEEWKKKYPQGIYSLIIPNNEGENSEIYFRRPNRADLNFSKSKRDPNAHDEQYVALAEATCIGGDKELFKDEQALISISFYMENMDIGKAMLVLNH